MPEPAAIHHDKSNQELIDSQPNQEKKNQQLERNQSEEKDFLKEIIDALSPKSKDSSQALIEERKAAVDKYLEKIRQPDQEEDAAEQNFFEANFSYDQRHQVSCQRYLESDLSWSRIKERIQRSKTKVQLMAKGVANPGQIIAVLEQLGFRDIFEKDYSTETNEITSADYSQVIRLSDIMQQVPNLPKVLERLNRFTSIYNTPFYEFEKSKKHFDIIGLLRKVGSISEEKFNNFLKELEPYTGLDYSGKVISFTNSDGGYIYEIDPNFSILLEAANQGGFSPEQLRILSLAQRAHDLTNGKYRAAPERLFKDPQMIENACTVVEQLWFQEPENFEQSPKYDLKDNLDFLTDAGKLSSLSDLINNGFLLDHGITRKIATSSLSSGYYEDFNQELTEILEIGEIILQGSDEGYIAGLQEYLDVKKIGSFKELQQLSNLIVDFQASLEDISDKYRLTLLETQEFYTFTDHLEGLLDEKRVSDYVKKSRFDKDKILELFRKILFSKKEAWDIEAIKSMMVDGFFRQTGLIPQIIDQFPEEEQEFLLQWEEMPAPLKTFLAEQKDRYSDLFQDGLPKPNFFQLALESYNIYIIQSALAELLTNDLLAIFPDDEKNFWRAWREMSTKLRIFAHQYKEDLTFQEEGLVPVDFINRAAYEIGRSGYAEIKDLLTGEVLAQFPAEEKAFWLFWKNAPEKVAEFIYNNKDKMSELVLDGQPQPEFFEFAIKILHSSYPLDGLNEMLTEDVISQFSKKDQIFWRFWKEAPGHFKYFFAQIREDFENFCVNGQLQPVFFETAFKKSLQEAVFTYLTDEVFASFPPEERVFWLFIKNLEDNLLLNSLVDSFSEPETLSSIKAAVLDERRLNVFSSFSESKQDLIRILISQPDLMMSAYDVLLDEELIERYQTLPPEVKKQYLEAIIANQERKEQLKEVVIDQAVKQVVKNYPEHQNKFLTVMIAHPDHAQELTSVFLDSDVKSILTGNSRLVLKLLSVLVQELSENESQLDLSKSAIFEILASNICIIEDDADEMLWSLEFCSKFIGLSVKQIILDNLVSINTVHAKKTEKIDFYSRLFSSLDVVPLEIAKLIETLELAQGLKILFEAALKTNYQDTFFLDVVNALPNSILSVKDKEALHQFYENQKNLSAFSEDERKESLLDLAANTGPVLSRFIVDQLLDYTRHPDDTDFQVSEDDSTNSNYSENRRRNPRNNSESSKESFIEYLKESEISSEDILKASQLWDVLDNLLKGKAHGLPESTDGKLKIETTIQEFLTQKEQVFLDESAQAFQIYHRRLNKERKISSFEELWRKRILKHFEDLVLETDFIRTNVEKVFLDSLNLYLQGMQQYQNLSENVIPNLRNMNMLLHEYLYDQGVWFSGRDGVPLYLSFKAEHWGETLGKKEDYQQIFRERVERDPRERQALIDLALEEAGPEQLSSDKDPEKWLQKGMEIYLSNEARLHDLVKYISISRLVFENANTDTEKERTKQGLLYAGINPKMLAVDTGTKGSVITAAMGLMGGISSDNMIIWGPNKDIDLSYRPIEKFPKPYDRTLAITEKGKPFRFAFSSAMQQLAWASEHCVIRHLAPRKEVFLEQQKKNLRSQQVIEIADYIVDEMNSYSQEKKEKLKSEALELYDKSQEFVAPVIAAFADHLLREAAARGNNTKIVFLARDALGSWQSAKNLLSKFPEEYQGVSDSQLKYAYITRKAARNSSAETLSRYFQQLGIAAGDDVLIADIGMFGTLIPEIENKLEEFNLVGFEYLISRTPQANGFLDNGLDRHLEVLEQIVGNPAIHFLEDTFSGFIHSPTQFEESEAGSLQPNTIETGYPPDIELKRRVALNALKDYIENMTEVKFSDDLRLRLDEFLRDPNNFEHLMVPHER